METEPTKHQKRESAQEVFKRLRAQSKADALERMQKIEDAQERAKEFIAAKKKKKGKNKDTEETHRPSIAFEEKTIGSPEERKIHIHERKRNEHSPELVTSHVTPVSATVPFPRPPTSTTMRNEHPGDTDRTKAEAIEMQQRHRKRRGRCTNCCGGLPGKGPGSTGHGCGGHCSCSSGHRMRGGSDTDRSIHENLSRTHQARSASEDSRVLRRSTPRFCGQSTTMSFVNDEARSHSGRVAQFDSFPIQEGRARGGCGTCGASPCSRPCPPPSMCHKQTEFRCCETSRSCTKGGCPCGGCGGSACFDNPGGGGIQGGCCGGNRHRGMPCKCKCQSCDTFRPLGGCGGQSCGKIYSCAGSGGGRCCFPRNHKRRSGPDCCGGANSNCGGCC